MLYPLGYYLNVKSMMGNPSGWLFAWGFRDRQNNLYFWWYTDNGYMNGGNFGQQMKIGYQKFVPFSFSPPASETGFQGFGDPDY